MVEPRVLRALIQICYSSITSYIEPTFLFLFLGRTLVDRIVEVYEIHALEAHLAYALGTHVTTITSHFHSLFDIHSEVNFTKSTTALVKY